MNHTRFHKRLPLITTRWSFEMAGVGLMGFHWNLKCKRRPLHSPALSPLPKIGRSTCASLGDRKARGEKAQCDMRHGEDTVPGFP